MRLTCLSRFLGRIGAGPNRRGHVALLTLPVLLLMLLACARIGDPDGGSAGTVSGDVLYVGTRDGKLLALDRNTGQELWRYEEEERELNIYGAPAVDGDTVYVGDYDGFLYALPTDAGSPENRSAVPNVPKTKDIVSVGGSIVGSPVVVDGMVLVGSSDGGLYAFDVEEDPDFRLDVRRGFPFETGDIVWSTPAVADGVAYFGSLDHGVYAVNLEDGIQKWRFPTEGGVVASPVVENGRVYVGSLDRTFYALDADTGKAVWRFDHATNWYWSRALVTRDRVYAPSLDGNMYALDKRNGTLVWPLETDGEITGSPVIVHDFIAVPSLDGIIRLVNIGDGSVEFICDVEEEIRSSLIVEDGSIYFRAKDRSVRALNITRRGTPDEMWKFSVGEDPGRELAAWACSGPKRLSK